MKLSDLPPSNEEMRHTYEVASRLVAQMRETSQMLTQEGWNRAYYYAMKHNAHTSELTLLRKAREYAIAFAPQEYR